MARSTIESSKTTTSDSGGGSRLSGNRKAVLIAAVSALVLSLGFVGWYLATSEPEYQEVKGAPPETSLLSIANMTNSGATVKVKVIGEATPPTGFKGDGSEVKNPLEVDLEPQQGDQFVFSDATALETDAPIELEIEANVGGTSLKATFTFPRKKRVYVNLYEAGGPITFDAGPNVTMK